LEFGRLQAKAQFTITAELADVCEQVFTLHANKLTEANTHDENGRSFWQASKVVQDVNVFGAKFRYDQIKDISMSGPKIILFLLHKTAQIISKTFSHFAISAIHQNAIGSK